MAHFEKLRIKLSVILYLVFLVSRKKRFFPSIFEAVLFDDNSKLVIEIKKEFFLRFYKFRNGMSIASSYSLEGADHDKLFLDEVGTSIAVYSFKICHYVLSTFFIWPGKLNEKYKMEGLR